MLFSTFEVNVLGQNLKKNTKNQTFVWPTENFNLVPQV
jgi:hypothetical protein